uniref:VWFD domain-containing protein n=1 Tax=Maylandia zebra TaxID=106582 RepID=A0A3P9CBA8_9CICH
QKCTCTSTGLQCRNEPCSFSQICKPASFQFSCQTVPRGTCTISGDPHYYTFDNTVFHFQGTCTYVLSEQCNSGRPYYRVEGKNEHRGSTQVSWTRLVKVHVYNDTIELVKGRRGQAKVNGNFASTPFSLSNGTVQVYESGFSVFVSTDFGLVVSYDTIHHVQISLPYAYQNGTCGLCGNFNGIRRDDFQTRDGEVVSSDVVFANSWQASGDDEPGCGPQCGGLDCAVCTVEETALYSNTDHCGILSSSSGPFTACHQQLPPQSFVDSCVYDLCVGGGYQPILCQALTVYASQCQQSGIQLPSWRTPGFCEIPCPANSHFESEGTGCPPTCVNPNSTHNCPLPPQESCICDSGYILSGGVCVPHAECGCSFEGRYYRSGQTVILDGDCGRRCSCSYGSMTCQSHGCGPLESCRVEDGERGCRPNSYETCWIRGPGSYQTFDGLTYQYPGACRLTLAKVMGLSSHPHFMVTAEKVPRGQQGFTRILHFEAEGIHISIEMVNGQLIRLPFSTTSNRIQIFHSSIYSVIIRTSFGVTVQTVWPHFVRVTAPGVYNGSLGGLCGNYNGHPHDDFNTPNGVLVNSSQDFGDSWRDGSLAAHCVESMNQNSTTNYNSTEYCGILSSPDGPFVPCWSVVDPSQQVDVCVEIIGGSNNPASTLCGVLRDYALMCQQKGVALGQWRNATGCALTCPSNSHYELCGTSCPSACPSLSFPFTCDTVCQEGCQCNNGFILNGDQCVPPTSCGCYHQGRYHQGGEQFWDGEECQSLCTCNGTTGNVHCTPNSCGPQESCRVVEGKFGCHPNPHGTCSASGDPHYITFDRRAYDFQGSCRYVLVTLCNATDELNQFSVEAKNEALNGRPLSIVAEVFVNGVTRNLPIVLNEGNVSIYATGSRILVSTNFGLSVTYNGYSAVFISVPPNYREKICGLCGNFNGNPNDDFHTPSGTIVTSPDEFGRAWKVPGNYTCNDGCGSSCPQCANEQPARDQCEVIQAADGPFSFCHEEVDPAPYFNDCVFDVCLSGNQGHDLLCSAIESYVSACQSANVRIYPWRENTTCTLDCPANSHYELCGTDCGHTCASSIDETCEQFCSEGCFCDEGFIKSGTRCVPVESCGCQYDGFYYDSFWTDGCSQRCECHAPNDLRCSASSCTPEQQCSIRDGQLGCYDAMSTCTVWGDPHYITFDGAVAHFQGTCSYIITESTNHGTNETQFQVIATNNHRGNNRVSFVSAVDIYLSNHPESVYIRIGPNKRVNGNDASLPTTVGILAQVVRQGSYIVVDASDLLVQFDGQSTLLVRLGQNRHDRVTGMCGNSNNDPSDDKVLPNGTLAQNDNYFGHIAMEITIDASTRQEEYSQLCSVITNTTGPFSTCHLHSDSQPFFSSCVYDLCLYTPANGMLCSAVSAYEKTCSVLGLDIPDWRSALHCGIPVCSPVSSCPVRSPVCSPVSSCPVRSPVSPCPPVCSCPACSPVASCLPVARPPSCSVPGPALGASFWSDRTCAQKCTCTSTGLQCRNEPCSFSQICKPASFQFSCQTVPRGTCTISGDPHYYTFDNTVFHFQGTCTYVLSEQCNSGRPYYRVEGKNEHRGSTQVSWTRLVKVHVYNDTIELVKGRHGQVNGNFASTPFSLSNGTVQVYESGFSVFVSTDFGLVVSYDTNHHVQISLPYTYQNGTCGLCGNFNGIRRDDFQTRDGEVVSSDVVFANSWQAFGDDKPGCGPQCGGLDCAVCTVEETALYSNTDHCGILSSSSGPFTVCHQQLPPQSFVDSCVYDLCVGGGYRPILCQALSVYASQCQQSGIRLPSWRTPGFCEIPCPANSHFESEGTGCPPTCVNPNSTHNCPLPPQESCICDSGCILSGGVCVPHAECGCSFEGRYYRSGQTVILDKNCGRRCSCSYGSMTCHSHGCGPLESCRVQDGERGCRPNSYETCWIRGPGSYQTFDGLTYQYPGACRLTLAKVMGLSSHPHFMVTAEKVPRGQQGFARILHFEAEGIHISIEMARNSKVKVNGQLIRLPFSTTSNRIQIFHSSIYSVIIRTSFGVTVQTVWPHFVRVTAPGVYNGSLGGLCGNYNGHPHDDFNTPNGVLINSSQDFGDSWRDGSLAAHCVESMNQNSTTNYNSTEYCGILSSPDGPFVPCWSVVDPSQQVDVCVEIMGGSNNPASTLCGVLRDYALMCQQKGVALGQWRNATGCSLTCPSNSHYELCGTSCPSACPSLSFPFTCDTVCQEGCQCNSGFILNGDQCVPPTSCGCYHQGRYHQGGEQFWDGEECQSLCTCNGTTGNVHCTPNSCGPQESCRVVEGEFGCHPNPHGTCSASGDPHYITFDRKAYDFQGTCRYVLVTLCNATDELNQFSVEAKNEALNGLPLSIVAEVFVNVWGYDVHMSRDRRGLVQVNGVTRNLPIVLNEGNVSIYATGSRILVSTNFGLSVTYNGYSAVFISVPPNYREKICGLCGNFNGNPNDDFHTPSGTIVTSPDEFGRAWKVPGNYTCNDGCGSSCPQCANEQPARDQCEVIQAADGPFSFCHEEVDPAPYFNDCVFDVCLSGNQGHDLLCSAIESYVSACQSANVRIYPWRENTTCSESTSLDCPANSHYELCGTDCGHTCASSIDETCEQFCSEGCFCDEGFIKSGTRCVPVESCGCQYDGFYYDAGESFWTDGCSQRCECHAPNDLRCSASSCTPEQQCSIRDGQLGCYDAMSTCTVWGDPHYITFDGALAHFQGTCSYIITESTNHGTNETQFQVIATNNHRGNNRVSFHSTLSNLHKSNNTHLLHLLSSQVNGNDASLPTTVGILAQVVRQGSYIVVDASDLLVQFDGQSTLLVRLGQNRHDRVTGMCGNSNNNPSDDKVLPNGTLAQNDNYFGHSWKSPTKEYSQLCSVITNTTGPFSTCHLHSDPQPFFSSCVYDLCLYTPANGMLCSAVSAYEKTCSVLGLDIPDCCLRPASTLMPSIFEMKPATGLLRMVDWVCVPHAECGCSLEGRYYRSGQTVILDKNCGRRCSCSYGSITFHSQGCGPFESCRLENGEGRCRPNSYETCWIRGPGSYQTFDGLTYQYPGACRLTLAKVMGLSSHPHFMVTAEKVPRGQQGFTRILHFEAEGIHVSIEMARNSKVKVNGQLIRLPFSTTSNRIQIFHSSIYSVIIRTSFGVTVQTVWPHFVRVTAPGVYNGSLGGLCGNYNGHPHDDFNTPNGVLINSSQDFGDSWRDGSLAADCVQSMNQNSTTNYNSTEYCGILSSPDGPFVPCWSVVDPSQQVDVCVEIMGGSNNPASTLCGVLRDYALMCQQKGVALGQWRNATGCALTCPSNSHYELCGSSCPSACPSLSFPFTCDTVCQEGCQCNSGFILNGDQCVPPTSCGCYHQGHYHQGGEQFWDGEECQSLCTCNGTTGSVHCTPNSCGPQESCRVVEGEFGCHPNPHGTCSATGGPHYITFDRKAYDFQGTCRYVLVTLCNATDELNQFSVETKNEALNGRPLSILAEVFVNVWGYNVHMSRDRRGLVQVNGVTRNLPIILNEGNVSIYATGSRILVSTNFGLSVTYNGYSAVFISVPPNYREKICGLCGNFNGNPNDDFHTPSGTIVTSPDEFGRAWKVPGNYTCNDGCGSSCPQCANEQPARDQCEVIQAVDGPFSFCHEEVDPAPYFNDCVFDVCLSGNQGHDLLCSAIESYVSACQSANVRIYPWRENTTCSESTSLDCPANSHYELCGTDCGHTCSSHIDETCEQFCSEGCFCDEGFIKSGTRCVPVESCGCQYDGFYYDLGASFWSDRTCAQKCTCTSTGLQCRNEPCSFSQICKPASFQFSCQTVPRGTCTISGDPHYDTFDNTVFHFQGTCTYVLSEQCNSGRPYYRVEGKNEHRGSTQVSWTRLVKVHVYNDTIELVKGRHGQAKSGFSVFVSTDFGLVVSYDTIHHVQISLPYTYQNGTCGLCGNFNGIRRDDFQTRDGEVVSSDVVFANSWQASGDDEPGCGPQCGGLDCAVCTVEETALYSNTDHCGILSSSSGPFTACHQQLPPQSFVESCVYDLCVGGGYRPILCQALSVYASQCQQSGIRLPSWRTPGFCEIPCPANSHFESEGTGCPPTCVNPNSTHNCPLPPQESCICDSGYILSGGVCVPHAECGCSFEGRYYRSGKTAILDGDCGRRCSCSYGSMTCHSHGCGPLESCRVEDGERGCRPNSYETCWIRGPGSYQTFDGLTYQYPGACRLTLAKVMGLSMKVSEWNTYLKLCSSFNIYLCTVWPHFVRVTAPGVYNGSLGGLCGNYNGHPHDDFNTPNGVLINSSQDFGDSWRDGSLAAHCVESMNQNSTTNYNSTEYCGILSSPDGPFVPCWSVVDPSQQVDVSSTLCGVLRDYALMCQQKGVALGQWRNATGSLTCPSNSHYELCGTSCPSACPSLSFPFTCDTVCQEGCQCNSGFILNGDQCVPPTSCGCYHQGRYHQGGEQFWDGEECQSLCTCNGNTGNVHCTPNSCGPQESCRVVEGEFGCHPNPHGTCSASGDPHYITFDRKAYDFQGTCRYVLVTLCNATDELNQFSVEAKNEALNGLPLSIVAEVFVNVWGYDMHMSRDRRGLVQVSS